MSEEQAPAPEEETPEGEEEKSITLAKEKYDELVEKLANTTQDKTNLIAEIKLIREKGQVTEAEAKELREKLEANVPPATKNPTDITPEKIREQIDAKIAEELLNRDRANANSNRVIALAQFKELHKEFHMDNDEGGIKMASFERGLERFNLGNLKTEGEFLSVFEDAFRLMIPEKAPEEMTPQNPTPTEPSEEGPVPVSPDALKNLSAKEQRIVNDTYGGEVEKYLSAKAKHPDYVERLLQYAR